MISIFNKRFIGIKIIKLFNIQIEFWICRSNSIIPWHFHSNISSTIIHFFGPIVFQTSSWAKKFGFFSGFKWSIINRGQLHFGQTFKYPAAFINIEYWHTKNNITSASKDLILQDNGL